MSNIEHSSITDPNIHEPKNISIAAANTVYAANGSGSGSWATLSSLISTNPFGSFLSAYTSGGNLSTLNIPGGSTASIGILTIETNTISGSTWNSGLTPKSITLPAGTYYLDATVNLIPNVSYAITPAMYFVSRLYNITDTTDILLGTSSFNSSRLSGYFTLAATKTVSIQVTTSPLVPSGQSVASPWTVVNDGDSSKALLLSIWKLV